MGAVYVARDERFGSTVAIKETLYMDDNFRKAIEREARLLNSLKHVALPRVSDHFEEDNGQFIVMEYIPGDDVATILEQQRGPFSVEQVLRWADQLLEALDYLHNQSIPVIHRDIKPQNLKITSRGQIVLLDFGLAKGNPTDAGHQTAAKSIFGYSRSYASLEQIQGTGTDPRSDLYSLAATLYHLLTNAPPEDALTRAMNVLSQKGDPLVPANLLNSDVPAGVAGVLQNALDLNASERPASASEMRQMLLENDKYAELAAASAISPAVAGGLNALAQPTRLMPEATRPQPAMLTDVKTEILPVYTSQVTKFSGEKRSGISRRRFGVGAGVLSLALVSGAVAGGIYLMQPAAAGETDTRSISTAPAVASQPIVEEPQQAPVETEPGPMAEAVTETGKPNAAEKPIESAKAGKPAARVKAAGETPADADVDIDVDENEPETFLFTRRDGSGKLTTVRVPLAPQMPPNMHNPFPRGFQPGTLTPEQQEKIEKAFKNFPRPAITAAPSPKQN